MKPIGLQRLAGLALAVMIAGAPLGAVAQTAAPAAAANTAAPAEAASNTATAAAPNASAVVWLIRGILGRSGLYHDVFPSPGRYRHTQRCPKYHPQGCLVRLYEGGEDWIGLAIREMRREQWGKVSEMRFHGKSPVRVRQCCP